MVGVAFLISRIKQHQPLASKDDPQLKKKWSDMHVFFLRFFIKDHVCSFKNKIRMINKNVGIVP